MRTNNNNKILMIVLIVVATVAIVGGVFAYLFLATDVFTSGQELFAKYLIKNVENLKEVTSLEQLEQLENKLKQSKYEENIEFLYSNPEDAESLINLTLDTQNDPTIGKYFGVLELASDGTNNQLQSEEDNEKVLKLEYMQESDMFSLRFTNTVKQFLTVQNANLKELAKKLGMDEETIKEIPNKIDFEEFSFEDLKFTEEEINTEVNKYASLLYNNISKEKYQKNKNVVITVNGKTITTNSYVLTLNKEDLENILIKLLETLKEDKIILGKMQKIDEKLEDYATDSMKDSFLESIEETLEDLKTEDEDLYQDDSQEPEEETNLIITIYEANKETVRMKFEVDLETITLDTTKQENKTQIDLNYVSMDEENTQYSNKISLIRENANKLSVNLTNVEGEEQFSTNLSFEMTENENKNKIDITIETDMFKLNIIRNIEIVNEISYKVTLNNSNNIVLNNLSSERLSTIITALGERLNTDYIEPLATVLENVFPMENNLGTLEEADVEMFNSEFEIYETTDITTEDVNILLNTIFTHNQNEIFNLENAHYIKITGDVTLEVDATEIEKIEGSKYYNVKCEKDENGYINEIVITEKNTINSNNLVSVN